MKLCDAVKLLRDAGVQNPVYDARELFIRIGKKNAAELVLPDTECSLAKLESAVKRRADREPLQYIIGEVGFYNEIYEVTPDCLIPRQDTEHTVDYAVKHIPDGKRFIDICTGSGCIAISTLKNTNSTSAVAIDISAPALKLAKRNAERCGVSHRVEFLQMDALNDTADGKFFAVLANPPYVTESAYQNLEPEIYFEPKIAFVGDDEGLLFYKRILTLYKDKLEDGGFFAFEIGYDQADSIRDLAKDNGFDCEIIKDYSDNDRVAVIKPKA